MNKKAAQIIIFIERRDLVKSKSIRSALLKIGTKPGSVVYTGEKSLEPININLISYNLESYSRKDVSVNDLSDLKENMIHWINIDGIHDVQIIESVGEVFGLDPLALEDIVTVGTRPKYDRYDNYSYACISILELNEKTKFIKHQELSIIIEDNKILTFQDVKADIFEVIRKRIFENKGRIRSSKGSYLFYCLVDSIVDRYFYVMNAFEEKIESLETSIMRSPEKRQAKEIYDLRRELLGIRTAVWPLRDILIKLTTSEDLFSKEEIKYLNDVNDNIRQMIDFITSYRDLVMGLYEAYLSNISNKMNKIMTTLTIFSVIFIPLTFLAGIYGMNFKYFPELNYKYAYPFFWVLCVLIVVGLYFFFKKKKWFI